MSTARFSCRIFMKLEFSRQIFEKNTQKIRPVATELFHADGQKDVTNLIVAFRNFAKSPKNGAQFMCLCSGDRETT
jgi:hypothetical protein